MKTEPRVVRDDGTRRRALRAARVVTLGLVLAVPGCYLAHGAPAHPEPMATEDAGTDAGPPLADAGQICDPDARDWADCCNAIDWDIARGCAAWGPFVPPGEVA